MVSSLEKILKQIESHSVLDPELVKEDYVSLDLSVNNEALNGIDTSSSEDLETYIWNHIEKHQAKVAFGGYLEKRNIYERSDYFNSSDQEIKRNIHLGLDLWIKAGSPIYAPLEGIIHSFKNNTNFGDYGLTIILEHTVDGTKFYTLYGHLGLNSLSDKSIGSSIKKGERIAALGTSQENGDYAPHLHFQIIKNLQGYEGDYPGVCNAEELDFYKRNCPNPNVLLKI